MKKEGGNMQEVLDFWFKEITPSDWFKKDASLDEEIRQRFLKTLEQAKQGELFEWRNSIEGRLAEIIVLDQFSRNIYRNDHRAFAQDSLALILAQEAVYGEERMKLSAAERSFLYMPFMHSESLKIHETALKFFSEPGLEKRLKYENMHLDILKKFGRYPHRNALLGRKSTDEEIIFLQSDNGF
ncbi:DUF924 domain-containing protein [Vagococcus lutrae]|uniref:DUF924 family protein n=1 Tax=Vagococcus lutrae TaxID=81947 RepID=UPI00209753F8|nr:DUF924 family protein [Vagococcus lutrae]MCO7150221.1 DUF924 domain-containing protein [Vagococcus lutrae]MDT2818326.1 DUF924 domain-containing protein [Vagococcus lutrae]MDT2843107.1 DUF924 domain-containing protein [Vagococcus lutrae]WCG05620.1 DUF924 domain-containing protein [Vagococcus lutrae]